MAVLARSPQNIRSIVRADLGSLRERTVGGLGALHLACEWPEGTELLLSLEANPGDCDDLGHPPLYYAIQVSCSRTVEMLLAAHSPLSYGNNYRQETSIYGLVARAPTIEDKAIYAQVIQALATRRRELAAYAFEHLPEQVTQDLHISQDTVPDLEAMEIFRHLKDSGHQIDRHYFGLCGRSVYEFSTSFNLYCDHLFRGKTMQMAYDAGFRNIDRSMVKGKTLLQVLFSNDKARQDGIGRSEILWWHRKGVDLKRPILCPSLLDDQILVIHRFSMDLGYEHFSTYEDPNAFRQVLQVLLDQKYMSCEDSCHCPCTIAGCTPWTNFLKVVLNFMGFAVASELALYEVDAIKRLLNWVLQAVKEMPLSGNGDNAISVMIRMLLFNRLGLRHQCCQFDRRRKRIKPALTKDEADEFKEEDRYWAEEFRVLLPRAIEQWKQSTLPLWDFLKSFYEQYIRPRRIDWEHVQAVQDIGVRIEAMADEVVADETIANEATADEAKV